MAVKNKIELIEELAEKEGVTKTEAERRLEAVTGLFIDNLAQGNDVKLSGFVHFKVSHSEKRKVNNPLTGEIINIPEKTRLHVKPMGKLKKIVEESGE